ncbi:hypothetical protein FF011L_54390 [Roseimaritima multifibrata]|uniref:Cadherin domain-containing protein n=1 Tax=Roseimaritima multifibrata TaxID=1930274 RepID=A0A517MPC5_9BACT|nr:Ig-like domain-containing protein [Roseimaritima multifibrata]QDS96627.1 hypothetical protein FF011L_54390 [Roseimaritima multifibrata]
MPQSRQTARRTTRTATPLTRLRNRCEDWSNRARYLLRETLVSEARPSSGIDAARLEDRILLSASPIAQAIGEGTEAITPLQFEPAVTVTTPEKSSSMSAQAKERALVIIDPTVQDLDALVNDLELAESADVDFLLLDSEQNGIDQISQYLASQDGITQIHLLTHGNEQGIQLGNTWLNNEQFAAHSASFASWSAALTSDADLLVYGCDLASSADGRQLLQNIAATTGADVAASDDVTGHANQHGDWQLEYEIGTIDTLIPFSAEFQQAWHHVLAANVAPTIQAPSGETMSAGGEITFSNDRGNAITVSDTDAGSLAIEVQISVGSGNLTLASTTGLTFVTGDGTEDGTVTFRGDQADINTALDGLLYKRTNAQTGQQALLISVDDLGNSGTGTALTDSHTVQIGVVAEFDNANQWIANTFLASETNSSEHRGSAQSLAVSKSGKQVAVWSVIGLASKSEFSLLDTDGTLIKRASTPLHGSQLSVAIDDVGNFVVVGVDNDTDQIFAQRYDSAGNTIGAALTLNTLSPEQVAPTVAMNGQGDFVVSWEAKTAGDSTIYFQRFNAAGTAVDAARVQVSLGTNQHGPSVGIDQNQNVIVSWNEDGGMYYTTYRGGILSNKILLSSTNEAGRSSLAMSEIGEAVIAWDESPAQMLPNKSQVRYQRINAAGERIGNVEFAAANLTIDHHSPDVALDESGDFVIAWDGDDGITLRRFGANGSIGWEEQIDLSAPTAKNVSIGMLDQNNIAVIWAEFNGPSISNGIQHTTLHTQEVTVTTTADTNDGTTTSIADLKSNRGADGQISLREAIQAANNEAHAVRIILPAGTYTFTGSNSHTFEQDIFIEGQGITETIIDGGLMTTTFVADNDASLSMSSLTLTGGNGTSGGAIRLDDASDFSGSKIRLTANFSSANGGAIEGNTGEIAIQNAELDTNNAGGNGGAISHSGVLFLENTTLRANRSGANGGAIASLTTDASTFLFNVTISGNQAGSTGGAILTDQNLTISQSTIAFNTAASTYGIHTTDDGDKIKVSNSILYNPGGNNANATFTSFGGNLDGDATAGFAELTDQNNVDPLLQTLAYNGGVGQTHALDAASTAIDSATDVWTSLFDQTGQMRMGGADIGAFETPTSLLTVDTKSDVADGDTSSIANLLLDRGADGKISLREAILATNNTANTNSSPDRIQFEIGEIGPWVIDVTSALPTITDAVNIDATTQTGYVDRPLIALDGGAILEDGIKIGTGGSNSTIRGLLIRDFGLSGISVVATAVNNKLQANWIGDYRLSGEASGTPQGNDESGITVLSSGNLIGGSSAGDGNRIGGNGENGILLKNATATANQIWGNEIGLASDGATLLPNGESGIYLDGSSLNEIGGTTSEKGNVIVGMLQHGIFLEEADNNTIQGNWIGTNSANDSGLGNVTYGIGLGTNSEQNTVGGVGAGEANVIRNNGVGIASVATARQNSIRGNIITGSTGLGIDLDLDGVGTNDAGDVDSGANTGQNYPLLGSAIFSGGSVTIEGAFDGIANQTLTIDFYKADVDLSGYGEAEAYLGSTTVTTDGTGQGTFTFSQAVTNFNVGSTVTATATDAAGNTSEFAANILAAAPNTAPTLTLDSTSLTTQEDTDVSSAVLITNITVNDDGNGTNSLQLSGTDAAHFQIIGSALYLRSGTVLDYESKTSYSVTVSVDDTTVGGSPDDSETFTLTIGDVNEAPVLQNDAYSLAEGGSRVVPIGTGVLGNDSDVDGDTLTASLVSGPANAASFTLNADGSFSYTHDGSETATDQFTYQVSDGTVTRNATVNLTITAVNDAPVAQNDAYTIGEGGSLTIPVGTGVLNNDSDAEGDTLTASLVSGPANAASFTLNADGSFSYTHDGSETATDQFTYQVSDGTVTRNATVNLTITAVNDAPVAQNDAYSVAEGGSLTIPVGTGVLNNDSDAEGDTLTASLVSGPANAASFTLNADGSFSYTHDGSETATDQFTYQVSDGTVTRNATVNLTITAANDAPVAQNDAYSVAEGGSLTIPVGTGVLNNDSDTDGDTLTASLVSGPANAASFTLNADGSFSYTHDGSETATDQFTYQVSDGTVTRNATVNLTITAVNDAPVAQNDAYTVAEGGSLTIPVGTGVLNNDSDAEGDTLTASLVSGPTNAASFTLNADGSFSYTHDGSETATDQFTYQVSDGTVTRNATVNLTITGVNDAPIAQNDAYTVAEGGSRIVPIGTGVLSNDSDVDGDTLTVSLVTGPSHAASFTLNADGSFAYTHNGNEGATDQFTYQISDGTVTRTATVTLTITDVNDAPIALPDAYTISEGGLISIPAGIGLLQNDSDIEGDTLTASLVSGPSNALAFGLNADGSFTYTHDGSETAVDQFVYEISDGTSTHQATVTVNVTPVNDAPVGNSDSYTLLAGSELNVSAINGVLQNDIDAESDTLRIELVSGPDHAEDFTLNADGSFHYDHHNDTHTVDQFSYRVFDGESGSEVITVTINILPIQQPVPIAPQARPAPPEAIIPEIQASEEEADTDSGSEATQESTVSPVPQQTSDQPANKPSSSLQPAVTEVADPGSSDSPQQSLELGQIELIVLNSNRTSDVGSRSQNGAEAQDLAQSALASATTRVNAALAQPQLWQALGSMQDQMGQSISTANLTIGATVTATTGITVGYVVWVIRGGILLSSLMANLPMWRLMDPMAILDSSGSVESDDESLESMVEEEERPSEPTSHASPVPVNPA